MKSLRPFEIALIGIFAAFALGGLIFIALFQTGSESERMYGSSVLIWGTFDQGAFNSYLTELTSSNKSLEVVRYVQIDERNFKGELLTAIAEGRSPDLVIIPHRDLVSLRSILSPISYEEYPIRQFRNTYIEGAEIFALTDGLYGVPFALDPLVMYWNRDLFSNAGLVGPPRTWEQLMSVSLPALVRKTPQLELQQSGVAMGEYVNVAYAKEVISMLLLQAGTRIVEDRGGRYAITLNQAVEGGLPTGQAAFSFYTQFASPQSTSYSWNRAQPLDRQQFIGGTLALYFAPGSELDDLLRDNPNLNFDVARVPQGSGVTTERNYGDFYAFAMPRAARNKSAVGVAYALVDAPALSDLLGSVGLAPLHRALIERGSEDPYRAVLYESALTTRGWLDPSPLESGDIIRRAIEDITSGRKRISEAVSDVSLSLSALFR